MVTLECGQRAAARSKIRRHGDDASEASVPCRNLKPIQQALQLRRFHAGVHHDRADAGSFLDPRDGRFDWLARADAPFQPVDRMFLIGQAGCRIGKYQDCRRRKIAVAKTHRHAPHAAERPPLATVGC
jgi:hypothetical protein